MTEPSAGLEQEETEHDVDLIHECVVKMAKEISDFMVSLRINNVWTV